MECVDATTTVETFQTDKTVKIPVPQPSVSLGGLSIQFCFLTFTVVKPTIEKHLVVTILNFCLTLPIIRIG